MNYHISYQFYQNLSRAFGEWLDNYDWDWYATYTFRQERSPEGAKRAFRRYLKNISENAIYFIAIEWHKYRDSVHIHSLIGGVKELRRLTAMDIWDKEFNYGYCRIYPYRRWLGAKYYLSKYLIKDLADWDFKLNNQLKLKNFN